MNAKQHHICDVIEQRAWDASVHALWCAAADSYGKARFGGFAGEGSYIIVFEHIQAGADAGPFVYRWSEDA